MAGPCQGPGLGRPRPGTGPGRPARDPARDSRAPGPAQACHAQGPAWRALLEAQWRDRLQEVTELSLAYHEAASAAAWRGGTAPTARHRPVGPASGRHASCCAGRSRPGEHWRISKKRSAGWPAAGTACAKDCAATIPARLLAAAPDTRYCRAAARGPSALPVPRWPPARHSEEDDDHRGREQPDPAAPASHGRARGRRRPGSVASVARPVRPGAAYCPVQARSSRSSVSAMLLVQILPLSMPARSSSGAREQL